MPDSEMQVCTFPALLLLTWENKGEQRSSWPFHAGEAHADQCELRLEVLHMAGPAGQSAGCPHLFLAPENDRRKAHTIHGLEYVHTALRCSLSRPAPDIRIRIICLC